MQTIQHATNLPYIPQYTIWNYAIEHPILFFMMVCFVALIIMMVIEGFTVNAINLIAHIANKNAIKNKGEEQYE